MKQLPSKEPGKTCPPCPSVFRTRKAIFTLSGVDEVHSAGQRDPGHAAGRGREGAQGAREELHGPSALHIVYVARRELVIQALHELILDGLG